ncbi:hypothetical protein CHUAL_000698 [Chamberlinius hualienensis]
MECRNVSKKRVIWTEKEVELMLLVIQNEKVIGKLDGKCQRNEITFRNFEVKLKQQNPRWTKSWTQIRTKWKSLKRDYYAELKRKNINGASGGKTTTCFDILHEIISNRPFTEMAGEEGMADESVDSSTAECLEVQIVEGLVDDVDNSPCYSSATEVEEVETKTEERIESILPPRKKSKRTNGASFQNTLDSQVQLLKELQEQDHDFMLNLMKQQVENDKELFGYVMSSLDKSLASTTSTFLAGFNTLVAPLCAPTVTYPLSNQTQQSNIMSSTFTPNQFTFTTPVPQFQFPVVAFTSTFPSAETSGSTSEKNKK